MKDQIKFLEISFHIILFFVIAIFYTFLGEYLQSAGFFGDTLCTSECVGKYNWGIRHWLYFGMSASMFILNCARIITIIIKKFDL